MRFALLALCMVVPIGCTSNEYSEGALKLRWTPPSGVKLESEATEGPITLAHFSGGIDVRSVTAAPLQVTGDLEALRTSMFAGGHLTPNGDVRLARAVPIGKGSAANWELQSASDRSQVYYVPGDRRYVLISLVGTGADFARRSDKLQLSLSTLQLQ